MLNKPQGSNLRKQRGYGITTVSLFLYDRKLCSLSYKKRRSAVDAHSREKEIIA